MSKYFKSNSIIMLRSVIFFFFVIVVLHGVPNAMAAKYSSVDAAYGLQAGNYVILLESNPEEFDPSVLLKFEAFKKHRLYSVPFNYKGKRWHSLRLGIFCR